MFSKRKDKKGRNVHQIIRINTDNPSGGPKPPDKLRSIIMFAETALSSSHSRDRGREVEKAAIPSGASAGFCTTHSGQKVSPIKKANYCPCV